MDISISSGSVSYIKLFILDKEKEIARLYLYFLKNDLHSQPFAFIEDVFVDENYRGRGIATQLLKTAIQQAKEKNCYKIICTSRYGKDMVHQLYLSLGFKDHGKEFRMDLIE